MTVADDQAVAQLHQDAIALLLMATTAARNEEGEALAELRRVPEIYGQALARYKAYIALEEVLARADAMIVVMGKVDTEKGRG